MKINFLKIDNYYILRKFEIYFNSNISILIGENGSGKSTLIEAINWIFGHLFEYFIEDERKTLFLNGYTINYNIKLSRNFNQTTTFIESETNYINVEISGKAKAVDNISFDYSIKINNIKKTLKEINSEFKEFGGIKAILPNKTIIYYSGIAERMQNFTKKFDERFSDELRKNSEFTLQPYNIPYDKKIFFIKPQHLPIILLALSVSDKVEIEDFLKKKLKIDFIDSITFVLKKPWWGKGEAIDLWGAEGFVKDFFILFSQFSKLTPTKSISKSGREILNYSSFSPYDLLDLSHHIAGNQPIENYKSPEQIIFEILDIILFSDLFENIDVSINSNENSFPYAKLSEGEKQLLLTYGLKELLNIENSVLLFDEPDTYLHPKWQREYISNISQNIENAHLIIATHSPQLLSNADPNKTTVQIFDHGKLILNTPKYYGKEIGDILFELMGIEARSENVNKELSTLFTLIEIKKIKEAKKLLNKLKLILGESDPDIQKASILIEF